MSVIVEATLRAPGTVLYETLTSVPEARVEIESLDGLDPERPVAVLWVTGGDPDEFDDAIQADDTVEDLRVLDELPERRLYRFQFSPAVDVVVYPVFVELGASLLTLAGQDGEWNARIRFPGRSGISAFQEFWLSAGGEFRLDRVFDEPAAAADPLTDRQREAVAVAYDVGYFDVPRSEPLATVADELGVSQQAASERLRRATHHLAARAIEK